MGSDYCRVWRPNIVVISIHAPRMGSDRLRQFQHKRLQVISIHAPRMGSDAGVQALQRLAAYFNPRSPNGERPLPSPSSTCPSKFQSTLPEWGATGLNVAVCLFNRFQSTLPEWGATRARRRRSSRRVNFNPRSPNGERPLAISIETHINSFQSTLPEWGATSGHQHRNPHQLISIHAPRMGSD